MSNQSVGANHLLGRGQLWFDRFDGSGLRTGERFMGNCDQFEITPNDDIIEIRDSAAADGGLVDQALRQRTLEFTIQMREFLKENIALALMGDVSSITQSATPITNEVITAPAKDRLYQIGGYLAPARNLSSVVVTGPSGTPTYAAGTDYILDAAQGTLYIPTASTISGNIEVDYTKSATPMDVVYAGITSFIEGGIRFVAKPARGPAIDAVIWRVQVNAQSALALISEEYASTQLKGKILSDASIHPTDPYGRFYKRT